MLKLIREENKKIQLLKKQKTTRFLEIHKSIKEKLGHSHYRIQIENYEEDGENIDCICFSAYTYDNISAIANILRKFGYCINPFDVDIKLSTLNLYGLSISEMQNFILSINEIKYAIY